MDRAWSVQLVSGSSGRLKAELLQDVLHRDLTAKPVEVDPGHDASLSVDLLGERQTVPFPLYI